jgi:hypothetical protein
VDEKKEGGCDEKMWPAEGKAEIGENGGAEETSAIQTGDAANAEEDEAKSRDEKDSEKEIVPGKISKEIYEGSDCDRENEVVDPGSENSFGHGGDEGDDDCDEKGGEWVVADSGDPNDEEADKEDGE